MIGRAVLTGMLVMLAGTIPVLGFFVEHRIVRQEKAAEATPQSASTPTAER